MSAQKEMPKYQCFKQVWALQIKNIQYLPNPDSTGRSAAASYGAIITPENSDFSPFSVDGEFVIKHKPVIGGYYVVYKSGYKSFSPAEEFESGYVLIK